MSNLITRTARLVPYAKRPRQVSGFVTAYSYEPMPDEASASLGNLYVALEVLVSGRASEEVADLIIETVGEKYYNHAKDSDPLTRFESAIKAVNQELGEHVNRGNAAWIGKLSTVIAVQIEDELHVAQTGSAEAFLYRGKSVTHITPSSTSRPSTPTKTFGSIASGKLEPEDRLLLATPALIHQVPLTRLQSVISESSPNASIAEITKLLHGTSTERVAALIIEITTPELAALQVRSEEPSEIQLGTPENALEAAKMAATPLAQTTVASSKQAANIAYAKLKRVQPHLRNFSLMLVDKLRQLLSTKAGRQGALIGLIAVAALTIGLIWYQQWAAGNSKALESYQQAYQSFEAAEKMLGDGDKTSARDAFQSVQNSLNELKPQERRLDKQLQNASLNDSQPKTLKAFTLLVADRLDQIDGLIKIDPITVANFSAKNARMEHFQIIGNDAYVFDSGNANALSIIRLGSGSIKPSRADMSKVGNVISTTISSANDGIYLLTDKPSVWFYRIDRDTITEQTIAYGSWPKATALASYASNLYLLGENVVYKHTKNATGYSPKTDYLTIKNSEEAKNAASIAIDGSVYLLSPTGLHRFIGGTLKQSTPTPAGLLRAADLRASGTPTITATDSDAKRVGLWQTRGDSLAFSKQVAPNGVQSLSSATYDPKTKNLYALADNRLIRMPVQP